MKYATSVAEFLGQNWEELLKRARFPEAYIHAIKQKKVSLSDRDDKPIWTIENSGKFSTKSAWEFCTDSNAKSFLFSTIWNKVLPTKISIFMWKLLHNKLPLDKNFQNVGISLASKCVCCNNWPQIEDRLHLFFNSQSANNTWDWF